MQHNEDDAHHNESSPFHSTLEQADDISEQQTADDASTEDTTVRRSTRRQIPNRRYFNNNFSCFISVNDSLLRVS